ncbi:MAG: hypothetical protein LQ346_008225 [Caloplaca aetnensis]|nr:MAG: hypothetical protein LQ346_008225 [Caloplaca aetnensis]
MRLHHLHLPGLTPYTQSLRIQSHLVSLHLSFLSSSPHSTPPPLSPPPPTLLTFQTHPTYTTGRRDHSRLTPQQISHLLANETAAYHPALRGGQTTFHGPGQLTAYLILNLKTHNFTARSYVQFLEESIIETCGRFGVKCVRTENPGVWTEDDGDGKGGRKLASVGVHLRRFVTSYGVGVNVSTGLEWFERIVMCGLPGRRATSFEAEGREEVRVEEVGDVLAEVIAGRLEGVEGLKRISEEDVSEGAG